MTRASLREQLFAALDAHRRVLVILLHLALIALSSYVAIWLRFDGKIPSENWQPWVQTLPLLIVIRAVTFWRFRLYQGLWRYTGIWDLRNIVTAVAVSSVLHYTVVHLVFRIGQYPRSVYVIDFGVLIMLMGVVRMTRRMMTELRYASDGRRLLIYGAGNAGEMIVRDMRNSPGDAYRPIGFVDDDRGKVGWRIHGVPVLGTRANLPTIFERYAPEEVLIAIPRADATAMRALVRTLEPFKVPIKTLPNLRDLLDGKIELAQIRNLSVEDLLPRAPVGLDGEPVRALIRGRRVLVTGAGGSIGSELCRQIAGLQPSSLVMLDQYENTLHEIRVELQDQSVPCALAAVIADITDIAAITAAFRRHKPEIVFHAAAHKHVPLMEENPIEAVKNNVRGTRILAQTADAHGVDRFILISTDKAVNPTSVMGASKRLAELVVQLQAVGSGTSFCSVRFGNVLASNGSVVPRLLGQIKRGGPLTVTHPEMRRFFMLIPEAVQLVLHAAAQADSGSTYVLEMGEQVSVLDMARHLIRLSGFVPDEEIRITFTGIRPGEKLYEELVGPDEEARTSAVSKILRVRSRLPLAADVAPAIEALERQALAGDVESTLQSLQALTGMDRAGHPRREAPVKEHAVTPFDIEMPADTQLCPKCGEGHVVRSRARGITERIRREMSSKRLFRCAKCGWRGWLVPLDFARGSSEGEKPGPDLESLDQLGKVEADHARRRFAPRDLL